MDEPILFKYAWVVFILITTFNAVILKVRSIRMVEQNPALQEGYDQLFKGYLLYMNIPWVVMGIGLILGGVPDTYSFFAPRHGNPFVIAFHVSIVILWMLSIWWVYFKGGAEFLVKYKGLFTVDRSTNFIKVSLALSLIVGMIAMAYMWSL